MRKNGWTTPEEYAFLTDRISLFFANQGYGKVSSFLGDTACILLTKFPARAAEDDRASMIKVCLRCLGRVTVHSYH